MAVMAQNAPGSNNGVRARRAVDAYLEFSGPLILPGHVVAWPKAGAGRYEADASRRRAASLAGDRPKRRAYSRVNCDVLS